MLIIFTFEVQNNFTKKQASSRARILVLKGFQFFLLAPGTLLTLLPGILVQLTNTFFLNVETVVKQTLKYLHSEINSVTEYCKPILIYNN